VGKQEKLAWLSFVLLLVAASYLGWMLLRPTFDDGFYGRSVHYVWYLSLVFAGIGAWVRRQNGPLKDERDQRIHAKALESGYAALILMLLVMPFIFGLDGIVSFVHPQISGWLNLLLFFYVVASMLIYSVVRVALYWQDRRN
jgi:hypothetical protein